MTAVFYKMTGSGNDFVMMDGRTADPRQWDAARIARICDRRNGIGGDGLVFVTPAGLDTVRMTYFNSDGSPAPMCGNAALCSTRLAVRLEMVNGPHLTLETEAATFTTRCLESDQMAELHLPDAAIPTEAPVELLAGEHWARLGTIGVPHAVVLVDDLKTVDVVARGRALRCHAAFGPSGANVNFLAATSAAHPPRRHRHHADRAPLEPPWSIRTYERGVEAETLACGTGTVAAALALAALHLDQLPMTLRSASGKPLTVSAQLAGDRATDIWLAGEARMVARGVWLDG